jgi:hypothetical protein
LDIEKVTEKGGFRHYENVTENFILPAGTGGENGVAHERKKTIMREV